MSEETEHIDVDWNDDVLGNFTVGDHVIIDKGQLSEKKVTIREIGSEGITVEDKHGQQYTVNVLRLSK